MHTLLGLYVYVYTWLRCSTHSHVIAANLLTQSRYPPNNSCRWRPIEASCDAPEEPWDEDEVRDLGLILFVRVYIYAHHPTLP